MPYLYLLLAIVGEVIGSAFLKSSDGFSKLYPTMATIISFLACFYFLSKTLQNLPLNITYASWAGLGLVLTTIISVIIFKEQLNLISVISIILIMTGVILLNTFGSSH
ncbi:QacCGHJ group quaternary ammonium compound efflux SMR transporter [Staphylococcus succinus]|uniref:QacCGHJ group quaternary ammonium compound efflux SMR transporter n=1 Tax=Staphylococcus succinus TaxID=61015 RepID=UPI000D1FD224|nr:QacCGHJ group quaternary ammonium compound efflux SMR transporter [Staphylococcus succinus]PTI38872.1 QacCGHJ group quaternary ammonium compound efflux SMR transporter [Staphylococcus succinus]